MFDIGCGAGSFYHLLKGFLTSDFTYFGVDLSRNQILTAIDNYGENLFDLKDITTLTVAYFNQFDFVHCYSVFPFLIPQDQMNVLKKILISNTKIFLDILRYWLYSRKRRVLSAKNVSKVLNSNKQKQYILTYLFIDT